MDIDVESVTLLNLVLEDSPADRQLVLCILARSNDKPARITFNPNTEYPIFYGYSNSKIPFYLMNKGVLSNVPREGSDKRLLSSHHLSQAETVINRADNWDIHQKLFHISKLIKLDNKTVYRDAEVFLVFKDKAMSYINQDLEPTQIRAKLSRKSLEKIWTVLQEIEDKRGITSNLDDISIPLVHFSKVKDDIGANNASDERRNILRKLEFEENAIKDVRLPNNLREYVYLKIGDKYSEVFDYYEKEYKRADKVHREEQESQLALRPIILPRYDRQVVKISPQEIVREFSSQNYPFLLMVLNRVVLLAEFSIDDKISYQLQSPPGQLLIQERALLQKFQSRGLFKNLGEDGIFGIATLSDINIDFIKQVITEIEVKSSNETFQKEDEDSRTKNAYEKLIKDIKEPTLITLKERYDNLVKDINPKLQKNKNNIPRKKPLIAKKQLSNVWPEDFKWHGNKQFVFGRFGRIDFNSKTIIAMFRELTREKGGWVTVKKLKQITGKKDSYVRPTIGQIEQRMDPKLKEHISIPSTELDNLQPKPSQGAYRIKFIS